jgi:mannose-6-phosphate isomerase
MNPNPRDSNTAKTMNYVTKPIPKAMPVPAHVRRPWGQFKQYAFNEECTVSLMEVKPGMRLSLQSHTGRAELWIVMDPGAQVQVGGHVRDCVPWEEIWIPANEKHRLSCVGDTPCRVLEVAFGNWQQEDITRYDDDFRRPAQGE